MFRKTDKLPQAPKAPTIDQIVDDLQTFKDESEFEPVRELPQESKNPERDFWRVYHTYMVDNKQIELTQQMLDQFNATLLATNTELREAQNEIKVKIEEEKVKLAKLKEQLKNH